MTEMDELEREVPALASLLVARYGERALAFASLQALKARVNGRSQLMAAWRRIGDAAYATLRSETEPDAPAPGVTVSRATPPALDPSIERLARRFTSLKTPAEIH